MSITYFHKSWIKVSWRKITMYHFPFLSMQIEIMINIFLLLIFCEVYSSLQKLFFKGKYS